MEIRSRSSTGKSTTISRSIANESTRFDAESSLITVVFHFCMRVGRNEKGGPVLYATLINEKFGAQFRTRASVLYTLRRRKTQIGPKISFLRVSFVRVSLLVSLHYTMEFLFILFFIRCIVGTLGVHSGLSTGTGSTIYYPY